MSEAQRIQPLLADLIACAGVFDVSTDYETDKADLEKATRAVLDYVQALRDERDRLRSALAELVEVCDAAGKSGHHVAVGIRMKLSNAKAALKAVGAEGEGL